MKTILLNISDIHIGSGTPEDGYIIAEKHGQLLVCELKEEQRIKEFSK